LRRKLTHEVEVVEEEEEGVLDMVGADANKTSSLLYQSSRVT
jgi:hypothetical protein